MIDTSSVPSTTPYALTSAVPNLTASYGSTNNGQNVDAVSKDFEAVFLSQMMGAMFSGDDVTSFFGGGTTGEVYKSYLLNEYGKSMAQAGGIGIAAQVKQELLKLQEVHAS
jgi:Rod binding domain-containing protein